MSDRRDLTVSRRQVFGAVSKGTECRVCGRAVDDGRRKTCSEYCDNIVSAVMQLVNWSSVRRRIIKRDDEACQACGYDHARGRRARAHIRARVDAFAGKEPPGPSMLKLGRGEIADAEVVQHRQEHRAWRRAYDEAKARYGDQYDRARELHVDHITPIADGGHPFDPANLQTLCEECHESKTAAENSERASTPSSADLNTSILEYIADGGDDV
jgi:5-methylcytosine-specific restriction endonuclease McrA